MVSEQGQQNSAQEKAGGALNSRPSLLRFRHRQSLLRYGVRMGLCLAFLLTALRPTDGTLPSLLQLSETAFAQGANQQNRQNRQNRTPRRARPRPANQNNRGDSAVVTKGAEALVLRAKTSETEAYLQNRIRNTISGLLTTPYSLSVRLNVDEEKLQKIKTGFATNRRLTPTDVERLYLSTIEQMSPLGFFANVKSKTIRVIVDQTTKADTIKAVQQAIAESVDLNRRAGDRITITKRDLSVEDSELKRKLEETLGKLTESETDLRSTRTRLESEMDQARDTESKNSILESRNRELVAEVERLKGQIEDLMAQLKKKGVGPLTPWDKFKDMISGLEIPLALLALGLLFAFAMAVGAFIEGRRNKRKLSTLQEVVSTMSSSFETIGAGIVDAAKVFTKGQETEDNLDEELGDADDAHVDVLERQAQEAWEEMQKKKPYVHEVLKDWLADKTKRVRFLQVCEAIGSVSAKELWNTFPKEETNLLAPLLDKPMTRAQAFKSVLLLSRFVAKLQKSKVPFFGDLNTEALIKNTDEKLGEMLSDEGSEGISTVMALVSPERSRRLLKHLEGLDTAELMSQAQSRTEFSEDEAQELLERLADKEESEEEEATYDVSDHFANILEFGAPEERKALLEALRENPELLDKLQKQVVTFDTVMKLDNDIINEQLEELEPEDIASLAMSLGQNDSARIMGFFNGKLLYRVQSEVNRMQRSTISKKRAEKSGEKIQKLIVNRVKKLIDDGLIEIKSSESNQSAEGDQGLPMSA